MPLRAMSPLLWMAIAACLLLSPSARADDGEKSHATLRDFYPTGEFDVAVSGKRVQAELLFSRRAASYLLSANGDDRWFLIAQRERSVSLVAGTLIRHKNGDVSVPKDAKLKQIGRATLERGDIVIQATGLVSRLTPRAPARGTLAGPAVLAHSPQYGLVMRGFAADRAALAFLKSKKNVQVEALFGTWCTRCQQLLGNMLAVEQSLPTGGAAFSYYGLPPPPAAWKEPHYLEAKIKGLPTAVVRVDGKVVGRLGPQAWKQFDVELARLLGHR